MESTLIFTYRGTTNANTIAEWKKAGLTVTEEKTEVKDETGKSVTKTTYKRPDVTVTAQIPELQELVEDEVGMKVLETLLQTAVQQVLKPYADENKVAEVPDVTPVMLWKALQQPVKASSLKATAEEMKEASAYFAGFLKAIGKTGKNADLQVSLFQKKYAGANLDKFAATYYAHNQPKEKVLELVNVLYGNVCAFADQVDEQSEDKKAVLFVPTQICKQNIEAWLSASEKVEVVDDLLNIDDF